ncbi:glycosyltransferase [Parasediminibacterium sp. JCM 36343]|uniref:glycosyltransferase n=1 Tax=Parasediminibacterium sp. JCM 36343 TaxID=3374279 RepID=UPI00397E0B90
MLQVLWLASWYPNRYDQYNGDFIQRHAMAVAPFCRLHVIHLQLVPATWQQQLCVVENVDQDFFTETIIYLRQSDAIAPLNKIIDQYNYNRFFTKAVKRCLLQQQPAMVHVHVPVKAGSIGLWLKRKLKLPMLVTEHWSIYNDNAPDKYATRSLWFKYVTRQVFRQADVFLPVSKNLGEAVNKLVLPTSYTVLFNVVDTRLFCYQPYEAEGLFWFAHVSMLTEQKNPKGLLRAFAAAIQQNKALRLRMIGNPLPALIAYIKELGIQHFVVFTGIVNQSDVASLLRQSQALVLFSFYENMPCVIAEAQCCGLPVIATMVGGIAEIVNDANGILIEPADEAACTKAMLQMAVENKYKRKAIAEKAVGLFSYEVIGAKLNGIYEGLDKTS